MSRTLHAPHTQPLRAVIFDMDGVLCDSEPFICQAAQMMFARVYGIQVEPQEFLPFVGTGENRYLGGVAEQHGIRLQLPEDKTTTYDLYLEIIRGRLQALPGVHDFIALCRDRGLKLAIASSADNRKVAGNLEEIALPKEYFESCITGDMVTNKKPDPEIFLTAAAQLEVPPGHCLVVEDAVSGVTAAKAAGAACLGITSSFDARTLTRAGADATAASLAEYLQIGTPLFDL